jgi:uncharacterized protein (TIGR00299 family) protein
VCVSPINVGGGTVSTRDGVLPVPGPAALELLRRRNAPVYASEYGPEFLTPTGALVLASYADQFGPCPSMRVSAVGYGAGQRDFAIPNVLRVTIGELASSGTSVDLPSLLRSRPGVTRDRVLQVETSIDDMNPEWYGHVSDRLFRAGALDVSLTPSLMKKGRPGTTMTVLAPLEHAEGVLTALFEETTTLGVRVQVLDRLTLGRRIERVHTRFGEIRVKLSYWEDRARSASPEYDDCREAAERAGVPIREVYGAALAAAGAVDQSD